MAWPTSAKSASAYGPDNGASPYTRSQYAFDVATELAAVETTLIAGGITGVGPYKIARGVHQQAAASDTIVTGLATVVAVVASFRDSPTLKQMFLYASIGDQAGAPAAGSILTLMKKPTSNLDVTPIAATDFSDNISVNWIAIGT